jgi:AraC-like DNA-binding protein
MIVSRNHIDLYGKRLIEKIVIETPFRHKAIFQDEACFLHFSSGNALINSSTQKIEINSEESILLKCGNYFADFIKRAPKGRCELFVIHLYPEVLKDLFQNEIAAYASKQSQTNQLKKLVSSKSISEFISGMAIYFEYPELVNPTLLMIKLKELILLILQSDQYNKIMQLFSFLYDSRKAQLDEIIKTHLFSKLSINELAILSGLSLSTFKREFKLHFKDSPGNYLKKKRLEEGAKLLLAHSKTISEIAYEVGFEDTSHFSRSFLQFYGQTPSQYRAIYKH